MHRDRRRFSPFLIACILLASACTGRSEQASDSATSAEPNTVVAGCPGNNAGLTLPEGFCATVFADGLVHARHIAAAPNGDVYVTLDGVDTAFKAAAHLPRASFAALRDTTNDGRADIVKRIGSLGNTGIGIHNGYLYVDEGKQIVRYARADSQLVPVNRQVVIANLPFYPDHKARNFAFGANGEMYVNVGSVTDNCQKFNRLKESPGVDPCPELPHRAGIWLYSADKLDQKFSPAERFATGLRNGMGLAVAADGKVFATQHARDDLSEHWPKLFPNRDYQALNPGEELVQIDKTDDFGWPYCYYAMDEKKLVDAPEYGGDGTKDTRCIGKKGPIVAFPGHSAPMSLMFYSGTAFPERYRNGVFIAFHGSWNRKPPPQAGYRVVFQPLMNGVESGPYETFANGFAGPLHANLAVDTARHRPVGLATAPDGAIYVSDDAGGRIYKIVYPARK